MLMTIWQFINGLKLNQVESFENPYYIGEDRIDTLGSYGCEGRFTFALHKEIGSVYGFKLPFGYELVNAIADDYDYDNGWHLHRVK